MTRIQFLHGAPDRLQAAVSWLNRMWKEHRRVAVYAPELDTAERLDRMLWIQPAISFVPHCRADSSLAAETPIVIASELDRVVQDECLLNLGSGVPPDFSRFQEVVEIVSTADADRISARDRYRFYRERGYELQNRDISAGVPA